MKIAAFLALVAAFAAPETLALADGVPRGSPAASVAQPTDDPNVPGSAATVPLGGEPGGPATLRDQTSANTRPIDSAESLLPFRNSTFQFDQSTSTQTVGLQTSPQLTYVPVYEWWLSFRPRYYFSERVYASARVDYYKEFTNAAQTTNYRADVFGDIWTNLVYRTYVPSITRDTKVSVGARLLFPTSTLSQDNGIYVQAGATAAVKQGIPINGPSAKVFNDAHVDFALWYNHPFSRATTPTSTGLNYVREDTGGRSFLSDQVSGTTLVNHQLVASLGGGLQITPKVSFNADMIFINQWHYALPAGSCVQTLTGCAPVATTPGMGTTFLVDTWFLTSIDYDLFDEITLSLGYYNLTNELGPDGQRRGLFGADNIWWSPSARLFFDVIANLDEIYEWASGKKTHRVPLEERNLRSARARHDGQTSETSQTSAGL